MMSIDLLMLLTKKTVQWAIMKKITKFIIIIVIFHAFLVFARFNTSRIVTYYIHSKWFFQDRSVVFEDVVVGLPFRWRLTAQNASCLIFQGIFPAVLHDHSSTDDIVVMALELAEIKDKKFPPSRITFKGDSYDSKRNATMSFHNSTAFGSLYMAINIYSDKYESDYWVWYFPKYNFIAHCVYSPSQYTDTACTDFIRNIEPR